MALAGSVWLLLPLAMASTSLCKRGGCKDSSQVISAVDGWCYGTLDHVDPLNDTLNDGTDDCAFQRYYDPPAPKCCTADALPLPAGYEIAPSNTDAVTAISETCFFGTQALSTLEGAVATRETGDGGDFS